MGKLAAVLVAISLIAAGAAQAAVTGVTDTAVPTMNSKLFDIAAGPDGGMWFAENNGDAIGRVTPCATGGCGVTETPLFTGVCGLTPDNNTPYGVTTGPDGAIWFTEGCASYATTNIARLQPCAAGGCPVTQTPLPAPAPGSSVDALTQIATGPDGALWVANSTNAIERVAPCATGNCALTATAVTGNPGVITGGPDGGVWFGMNHTIGRVAPCATGSCPITMTTIGASGFNDNPGGIVVGPDKAIWFTETEPGKIGRLAPCASGHCAVTETTIAPLVNPADPAGGKVDPGLSGIAVGSDGGIWFTEAGSGRIGRLTPCSAGTCAYAETAPNAGLGPLDIAAGPDAAMWFTDPGTNAIARIDLHAPLTAAGGSGAKTGCTVPRLIKLTLAKARTALAHAHCKLGRVTKPRPPRHGRQKTLVVASQSIKAGTKKPAGTAVNVRLAARK